MNILFFTDKNLHGVSILENLTAHNVQLKAIVIDQNLSKLKGFGLIRHHLRNSIPVSLLNMLRRLRGLAVSEPYHQERFYQKYCSTVFAVPDFNSQECENLVDSLEPDILILGGARVIKNNILRIPKQGVLNAHPGILPKYRGVDVIRWAIYHSDPIGVTVHFVNAGVDTGAIIKIREIKIEPGNNIDDLKKKVRQVAGELMTETVLKLFEHESVDAIENRVNEGKQYYKMPSDKVKEVDTILKNYEVEKDN